MFQTLSLVALGGALGSAARYLVNVAALRAFGSGFPAGTMAVNIAGSFLMGVLVVVVAHFGGNRIAPFLMTGVLGGFTTFSAFSLDAVTLWDRGQTALAATYIAGTVVLSLTALVFGMVTARSLA
jgi:fluoride exporter